MIKYVYVTKLILQKCEFPVMHVLEKFQEPQLFKLTSTNKYDGIAHHIRNEKSLGVLNIIQFGNSAVPINNAMFQ